MKMWTPQYDIIIETLTGSEFEITVSAKDTVGYIKSRIQKHEGIPIGQQHLLYKHKELNDGTEMRDVPLVKGSRLKLVLGMKGGPVSARRVVTLPDYDRWFDLNDILNTSRQDPLTISTPNVKLLVYKDSKKNIHRVMKLRADRKSSLNNRNAEVELPEDHQDDQWLKDNIHTMEKMHQLRSKLESQKKYKNSNQRQKQQSNDDDTKSKFAVGAVGDRCINKKDDDEMPTTKSTIGDGIYKALRRLHFPPLKTATSAPTNLNHTNDYAYGDRYGSAVGVGMLNKHGIAKTCIRPPSLIAAQKQARKSPTPPLAQDRSTFDFTDYFNVNSKLGFAANHYAENRTKIRDNIRRNRSFKAINFNDLIVEENSQQPKPLTFEELLCNNLEKLEKLSATKLKGGDSLDGPLMAKSNVNCLEAMASAADGTSDSQASIGNALFENKMFSERQQSYSLNGRDKRPCSGEFKIDSGTASSGCGGGGAIDSSFRVFKMTSEAKNCYELPKLLIREDSPVESFHSSDPQLETIALRGDSPKNVLDSFAKINTDDGSLKSLPDDSKDPTDAILKSSPWSHHHSDLGLNNLELNFLNDELSDCEGAACLKKSNSVLKIASNLEINNWKTTNDFDRKLPPSMTELDFVTSDCESDDEDNAFNNSICMHNNAKSKSVELNEFRMMFGSSPTLLNINPVTQTSFLDAVPFQYRRGYTNLNDACLSSSTSDLECFHSNDKKSAKTSRVNGVGSSQEVSSLLRHRNNGHLDYVRSYENLDRAKIVRMKNEKRASCNGNGVSSGSGITRSDWKFHNHFERDRVQEEDSGDDYSYSNLGYDNTVGSVSGFPVGYQSNESLFNINFDSLEDDVFEINSKLGLFEASDMQPNSSSLLLEEKCKTSPFLFSDLSNMKSGTTSDTITEAPTASAASPTTTNQSTTKSPSPKPITIAKPTTPKSPSTPKKPQKLRCVQCNKKLGVIMVMKCHCQKVFCAQHRYAEAHNCSYDFKQEGKQILARENPLVVAQKLPKI